MTVIERCPQRGCTGRLEKIRIDRYYCGSCGRHWLIHEMNPPVFGEEGERFQVVSL